MVYNVKYRLTTNLITIVSAPSLKTRVVFLLIFCLFHKMLCIIFSLFFVLSTLPTDFGPIEMDVVHQIYFVLYSSCSSFWVYSTGCCKSNIVCSYSGYTLNKLWSYATEYCASNLVLLFSLAILTRFVPIALDAVNQI